MIEKNKSNNLAVCIICGALTAFGIVASIISLFNGGNGIWIAGDVVNIAVSLLVGYYAVFAYRKPHGNLLKYTMLFFSVIYLISVYILAQLGNPLQVVVRASIIGLCCYIAGRLHRVKQNIILMGIVTVLILSGMIAVITERITSIGVFTPLIIWLDICVAYFLRCKEHKLAGLMDKTEEEKKAVVEKFND